MRARYLCRRKKANNVAEPDPIFNHVGDSDENDEELDETWIQDVEDDEEFPSIDTILDKRGKNR